MLPLGRVFRFEGELAIRPVFSFAPMFSFFPSILRLGPSRLFFLLHPFRDAL